MKKNETKKIQNIGGIWDLIKAILYSFGLKLEKNYNKMISI